MATSKRHLHLVALGLLKIPKQLLKLAMMVRSSYELLFVQYEGNADWYEFNRFMQKQENGVQFLERNGNCHHVPSHAKIIASHRGEYHEHTYTENRDGSTKEETVKSTILVVMPERFSSSSGKRNIYENCTKFL